MLTVWTPTLEQERKRFHLAHTCEECGHWSPAREACRHEWPTAAHRQAAYDAVAARGEGEVIFCKEFELC